MRKTVAKQIHRFATVFNYLSIRTPSAELLEEIRYFAEYTLKQIAVNGNFGTDRKVTLPFSVNVCPDCFAVPPNGAVFIAYKTDIVFAKLVGQFKALVGFKGISKGVCSAGFHFVKINITCIIIYLQIVADNSVALYDGNFIGIFTGQSADITVKLDYDIRGSLLRTDGH